MIRSFLLVLVLVTLGACTQQIPLDTSSYVCDGLSAPLERHLDSLVTNGEAILRAEAGEVIVTATEVAAAYDGACQS